MLCSINTENKFETDAFLASSHNKLQACKLFVFTFGLPSIEQAYADIKSSVYFYFFISLTSVNKYNVLIFGRMPSHGGAP